MRFRKHIHHPIAAFVVILIYSLHFIAAQVDVELPECYEPCSTVHTGNEVIPGTDCALYHECSYGEARARRRCSSPLKYDVIHNYCNWDYLVQCPPDEPCGPSDPPTESPIFSPTGSPSSSSPTESPLSTPPPTTGAPDMTGTPSASPIVDGSNALEYIASKRVLIERHVLISYTSAGVSYRSTLYKFDEFMKSLEVMGKDGFGADFQFFLFDGTRDYHYGLVNTAAFLANAMVESISADSCDEYHEEGYNGRYATSNSCGQWKRSYQDEKCDDNDSIYSCDVDPNMQITAVTKVPGARSPPPFICKPGKSDAGYWDTSTGVPVIGAYSNSNGRTDVEGCCFWGRGALLTKNVCNLGKLNYYLGKGGAKQGRRNNLYPDIDFCADPEATCSSTPSEELRWRTGMFEWSEKVQRYSSEDWNYEEELRKLVDGGLRDESLRDFITTTSRILPNGCHKRGCAMPYNPDIEIRKLDDRIENFDLIVNKILEMKSLLPLQTPKPINPLPSPPNQSPTFVSPSNNIEQTNPGPTIQLAPSTPQRPPALFQPPTNTPPTPQKPPSFFFLPPTETSPNELQPNVPMTPANTSPGESTASDDNEMTNLIVLEDNGAFQIGVSRRLMLPALLTSLHFLLL